MFFFSFFLPEVYVHSRVVGGLSCDHGLDFNADDSTPVDYVDYILIIVQVY